jgi:hypothetical protein
MANGVRHTLSHTHSLSINQLNQLMTFGSFSATDQRLLGTSLKPERSTLDQVRQRLEQEKLKRLGIRVDAQSSNVAKSAAATTTVKEDTRQEEQNESKEQKAELDKMETKKATKEEAKVTTTTTKTPTEANGDDEFDLSAFGLPSGFGGKKN